jgi:hypothetical protein
MSASEDKKIKMFILENNWNNIILIQDSPTD